MNQICTFNNKAKWLICPAVMLFEGIAIKSYGLKMSFFQIVLLTETISLIWQYDSTFLMLHCTGLLAPVTLAPNASSERTKIFNTLINKWDFLQHCGLQTAKLGTKVRPGVLSAN